MTKKISSLLLSLLLCWSLMVPASAASKDIQYCTYDVAGNQLSVDSKTDAYLKDGIGYAGFRHNKNGTVTLVYNNGQPNATKGKTIPVWSAAPSSAGFEGTKVTSSLLDSNNRPIEFDERIPFEDFNWKFDLNSRYSDFAGVITYNTQMQTVRESDDDGGYWDKVVGFSLIPNKSYKDAVIIATYRLSDHVGESYKNTGTIPSWTTWDQPSYTIYTRSTNVDSHKEIIAKAQSGEYNYIRYGDNNYGVLKYEIVRPKDVLVWNNVDCFVTTEGTRPNYYAAQYRSVPYTQLFDLVLNNAKTTKVGGSATANPTSYIQVGRLLTTSSGNVNYNLSNPRIKYSPATSNATIYTYASGCASPQNSDYCKSVELAVFSKLFGVSDYNRGSSTLLGDNSSMGFCNEYNSGFTVTSNVVATSAGTTSPYTRDARPTFSAKPIENVKAYYYDCGRYADAERIRVAGYSDRFYSYVSGSNSNFSYHYGTYASASPINGDYLHIATAGKLASKFPSSNPSTWKGFTLSIPTSVASTVNGYSARAMTTYSDGKPISWDDVEFQNCTSTQTVGNELGGVEINGGNYSGSPALQSGSITVNKGTLTDNNSTKSTYIVGEDSEASSTTSGATTVTQVKLSNPPVTINWDDFPMPDLSAPTIEVTRNPGDTKAPCTEVTLTIKATDPDGNDSDTPISVNGGAFQASPATYTVTENGSVDIVARDANGNTRTFTVNVNNIDSEAPTIDSFTKSNTEWTDDPVRVTVAAHDDVKLHETPYKWSFTANSNGSTTTSDWTSEKSYRCEEAGVLQVTVRDKMGHETVSDEFEVFNIDKIAPSATISITPDAAHEASAKTGVTAELSFNNVVDTVSQQASPLSSAAVLWDPGEGWTEQTRHVYKENGTYQVQVRDSVGNVSDPINFTISNISTSLPVIDSFVSSTAGSEFAPAPAAVTVTAHASGSATLPARPYSWDEGQSWTSQNSLEILENGEYTVQVRDSVGNQVEATIVVSNIDPKPPTVGVYVYKGLPADGSGTGPDDYVWKVRVEADDVGSGIDHVETLWDSGTHSTVPVIQDIEEPGIYGAIAYDKAGNRTYAEKVVTAESIGESAGGTNGSYVDIKVPSSGSAGSYMDAALQDLVYGPTGAYNKSTDTFKTYEAGSEGITANMTFTAKSSRYVTGYATFNAVKYPVTFDGGATGIAGGRNLPATVYIPISSVTGDVRQGRLTVVLQEWEDNTKTTLVREGSATFYTSVQVTSPVLNYQYSAGSDELLVTGTSSVAGISDVGVQLDGGAMQTSFPVSVGSATSIRMVVRDKVGQETEMTVSNTDLQLNGMSGGVLPTQTVDGINSYVTRSRNGTLYIVNGTQSNTDQIPASEVFDALGG